MAATRVGHRHRADLLTELALALRARFERSGGRTDLAEAIQVGRQAVAAAPAGHPDIVGALVNLGALLRTRFEHAGADADLAEAIAVSRQAVDSAPIDHPYRDIALNNLGNALARRFGHTGSDADLHQAVAVLRQAVAATPTDHPDHGTSLNNLGTALSSRFERTGRDADLDEAIDVLRRAAAATPTGHPNHAGARSNLGHALHARFARTGVDADLDEAVTVLGQAVDAAPTEAGYLSNLGMVLRGRFDHTGVEADLDEAVGLLRQAVDVSPTDHVDHVGCLSNLGNALQVRFHHFGTGRDLDEAVTVLRRAADASPAGHPSRPRCLSNLGNALRSRHRRTGSAADLDEAVQVGRQAVDGAPADHPERAVYLTNLAVALLERFAESEVDADLDASIDIAQQAIAATPRDHPDRALRLSNLSLSLEIRYERTGASTDLDEAVDAGRDAVRATPAGHPDRARNLSNLGAALHTRFTRSADAADLDAAAQAWARACAVTAAPAAMRVAAADRWGRAVAGARGPAAAIEAYAAGIDLLPLLAWRGIDHSDRQRLLETHAASLARDGAACAIDAGRLDLAVELLEHGRGMFWSQLLDTRTDLTALQRAAPDVAEQLHRCRAVLTGPLRTADHHSAQSGETRRQAARRFEELLDLVRAMPPTEHLPHPERFLRPPPVHTLLPEPGQDPTVIVNLSRWRCDALVLAHGGVDLVELPDVTEQQVITEANRYLDALHGFEAGRRASTDRFILEMAITATLEWLWDHITRPILDALGHTTTPRDRWPRLWWCPTGALTVLPLHAAGYHHTTNTVHDRVVSSYTPTLRALHEARVRPESTQPREILVIALPDTPRREALPGASIEQELLCASFAATHRTVLAGPHVTHDTVLAEISRHRWLHASCHGTQNLADPTEGGLLPYDWDTAGPIRVTDLTASHHLGGEFAFLSACKTATGGLTTLDEAITVAAAMQHAGWRHVVGTLWSVWDESAATVTREMYARLVRDGHLDPTDAARALHHAVRALRDGAPHSPSTWAPFIHTGP